MVYDVGAGIGLYAVLAARHRGAPVIAFEPSYGAFKDLCENLLLNGCDGRVTALPMALADFEGLGALKYPVGLRGPGAACRTPRAMEGAPRGRG